MRDARKPSSPLHVGAILFVAFVCAIMLSLDLRQVWLAHDVRVQQASLETENLARSLAQHAQDIFESTDAVLKGLRATLLEERTDPGGLARLSRRMAARVANQDLIGALFLFDQDGHWIATSLDAPTFEVVRGLTYTDRDYFRFHRDNSNDTAFIGPPIQTKLDGRRVVTLSRRLYYVDGSFAGIVGASVSLDKFQKFFESFDIGSRAAISLTKGRSTLMVRRPFDVENIGRDVSQSELFRGAPVPADVGTFAFTSLLDGTPRLGSFHRVQGFDLIMTVALDKNEVLASWRRETQTHLVWLSLIVVLVALLGYRLTAQIRRRAAAELQLAISQQTLEQRVQERTADLQQIVGQRDLLLREVYHRVKNNMQVVEALLAMEVKHLTDTEAQQALLDVRTRVAALGLAHQQLMDSANFETFDIAPFLGELARKILASRAGKDINLLVNAMSLMVHLDFAVPAGLVVTEIMTNYLKHRFLSGNGQITVTLQRNTDDDVVLTVSDNSLPGLVPNSAVSDRIARRAKLVSGLVAQIDGVMTEREDNGWRTEIVFRKQGLSK